MSVESGRAKRELNRAQYMEFNTHQAHRPGPFSNLVPVGKRDRIQAWRDPVPGERTNERTNKVSERRPTSKRKYRNTHRKSTPLSDNTFCWRTLPSSGDQQAIHEPPVHGAIVRSMADLYRFVVVRSSHRHAFCCVSSRCSSEVEAPALPLCRRPLSDIQRDGGKRKAFLFGHR